jgi:two-component system, cell cycle sensor histidine kinase and response regulator CckA
VREVTLDTRVTARRPATAAEPTLLVVDDEWVITASIADYFRELGFAVLQARSADGAMQYLKDAHVDVVVSDISMPGGMSGIGLAKWILREQPGVVVVLMSGRSVKGDVTQQLGPAVPFFAKPFDLDGLQRCIHERLAA